jgi:hypothetical protein
MTVDRVHVLATPGLDRHAAYVALSRHRDGVEVHFGRDDFADRAWLVRTLSRERGKDMASDYTPVPDRVPEPIPKHRDPFASLKLRSPSGLAPVAPDRLGKAVERFGRAAQDVVRMREQGYEALPHQRQALAQAREALDAIQPDAAHDLRAAMNRDPSLIGEAAEGRTARAVRAMTMERGMRIDTAQRADRFVADWQARARFLKRLERSGDDVAASRVKDGMVGMTRSLERDPQLESLLRNRRKELGIGAPKGGSLSRELQGYLNLSRSRGLGR